MAARPPERILETIIKKEGKGATIHRKFAVNKERNWLLALTLNCFAKLASNNQLTDLEQSIVTAFQNNGFTDNELKKHGQLYEKMPDNIRKDFFPGKFAQLTPRKKYTFQDLEEDAPKIVKSVLDRPNVLKVDVPAIHAGTATLRDFPDLPSNILMEHAGAMLVALEPNTTPPSSRYTIKASSFRCNDRCTDKFFAPSNEPYWIFGSLGGGTAVTTRSQVFSDVDSGESRTFSSTDGCIWGQNCTAQELPEGEIGSLIQLWENDEGNPDKIKNGVAAAFAAAAGILTATGVAAWVAAVVAGVGAVVQWLLGFLDDDHVADQTIIFTRQLVENQLNKTPQSSLTRRFADGDCDYTLTISLRKLT